jgi:hypothetical protein
MQELRQLAREEIPSADQKVKAVRRARSLPQCAVYGVAPRLASEQAKAPRDDPVESHARGFFTKGLPGFQQQSMKLRHLARVTPAFARFEKTRRIRRRPWKIRMDCDEQGNRTPRFASNDQCIPDVSLHSTEPVPGVWTLRGAEPPVGRRATSADVRQAIVEVRFGQALRMNRSTNHMQFTKKI